MITAYVLIQTEVGQAGQVASAATEIDGVQQAQPLAGPYDVIVRAEARDIDALGRLVVSRIQAIYGVTRTLTCSVVHLLAAMEHATRAVLAQRQVGGAPEEVTAFAPLLAPLDLAEVVVTTDALQTQPEAAEFLVANKHAHYLFVVKANQPTLLDRCQRLPWHRVPELDRTCDRGHGRIELRTLKAISVHHFGFPHAAQILQVTRKTRDLHDHPRRCRTVTVYAITSLPFEQAGPARLADLLRGHWAIEALHHVRDTTFCEDSSQTRTGAAPNVMACLRNLVIGVLSRAGPVNVAAALRRHARDPRRPLATLGISLG
jgi:predicted transposase YbfD/YdcC